MLVRSRPVYKHSVVGAGSRPWLSSSSQKASPPRNIKNGEGILPKIDLNARMDEGRTMFAAQPEILFTYPSPAGDYDKIK